MKLENKKALSIVVGYVLLIVFASIVGVIVYKWQKTYVPQDEYAACPEGASLFITSKAYNCNTNTLTFEIKNNGQFAVGGYFIYLKDDPEKTIATIDISINNTDPQSKLYTFYNINGVKLGRETLIPALNNSFMPGDVEIEEFLLPNLVGDNIHGIEIVPIRWQEEGNRDVLASCKENKISEVFDGCTDTCIPLSISEICGERVCGKMLNNCYNEIECIPGCNTGEFCDSTGNCIIPVDCTDTCESLNFECGSVCGVPCGEYNGACLGSDICDEDTGQCIPAVNTCNGVWNAEDVGVVDCDGVGVEHCSPAPDGCDCDIGYASTGTGGCSIYIPDTIEDCSDYCLWLGNYGDPYTRGDCQLNPSQCSNNHPGGVVVGVDIYNCGDPMDDCCCYP